MDEHDRLDLDPALLEDARATLALAVSCSAAKLARTSALEDALGIACLGDGAELLGAPGEPGLAWPSALAEGALREAARRVIEEASLHTEDQPPERAEWWDDQSARAERILSAMSARF
ncbi:MAG: hypothetical protein FJW99_01185 [Actinobacteria bacterium]|nr:hypothetical protein [Actinomycetota bacterium]